MEKPEKALKEEYEPLSTINEIVEGFREIGRNISERMQGYLENPITQLFNDVEYAYEKFWEMIAAIVLPVPLPFENLRDIPRFIIDSIQTALGAYAMTQLSKKFQAMSKSAKLTYSFLTGGPIKPALQILLDRLVIPALRKFAAYLMKKLIPYVIVVNMHLEFFKQSKLGQYISKALSAIGKGLAKVFKAISKVLVTKLSTFILGILSAKVVTVTATVMATIVGIAAGLAALAAIGILITYALTSAPPRLFATGGFPECGKSFIACEAGPELVGRIGSNNAVVNNEQMVQGIEDGVYKAFLPYFSNRAPSTPAVAKVYFDGRLIASATSG